jgi:hypothetical protein
MQRTSSPPATRHVGDRAMFTCAGTSTLQEVTGRSAMRAEQTPHRRKEHVDALLRSAHMHSSGTLSGSVQAARAGAAPVIAGARELQQRDCEALQRVWTHTNLPSPPYIGRRRTGRRRRARAAAARAPGRPARPPAAPAAAARPPAARARRARRPRAARPARAPAPRTSPPGGRGRSSWPPASHIITACCVLCVLCATPILTACCVLRVLCKTYHVIPPCNQGSRQRQAFTGKRRSTLVGVCEALYQCRRQQPEKQACYPHPSARTHCSAGMHSGST